MNGSNPQERPPQTSITFRISCEEKEHAAEQAKLAGLSLSEYLRRRFSGKGRSIIAFTDANTVRELRRLGGLLKNNFETLRATGVDSKVIELQEEALRSIGKAIDRLGAQDDR